MMKERTVRIFCKNNQQYYDIPAGSTLEDLYPLTNLDMPYGPVSAKVNNKVEGLHFVFFNNKDVEFLDITSASGLRTYTRSLFFVLYKAVSDLYPNSRLRIDTPVSNGYYCRLQIGHEVTEEDVGRLRLEMHRIVARKLPFHRVTCHTNEAIELFKREGRTNKVKLLESTGQLYTTYYTLDGLPDYYYGSLLTNTEQLYMFDIIKFADGILLRLPDPQNPSQLRRMVPQPKMLEVFDDHHRWQNILGISTIGEFNEACAKGATNELINVSEALQEKKISAIADRIASDPRRRVILISGPSSSGKTTFSKRLSVQLMACGLWPMPISLDDYFVDRDKTPLDAQGEYDFENIEALNIPLLTQHINALLQGEEVELPRYNFQTGRSEKSGKRVRLENHQILLLEGIHALNPALTADIDDSCKFKIYASALTTILLDDHNYIPTNAGGLYPNNNSKLGLFQAAMQIRRSSRLNCINSVAVGFPIGLIIDGDKGNTVESAKNGMLKLQNLIFAGMTALGSDNNKKYEDQYYDKTTGQYDPSRVSYSHEFFMAQTGNQVMTENQLALSDPANVGQNYCPAANSPLLSGASFNGITSLFLNKVSYIGAFGGNTDNWMSGWTNFDPQNTVY